MTDYFHVCMFAVKVFDKLPVKDFGTDWIGGFDNHPNWRLFSFTSENYDLILEKAKEIANSFGIQLKEFLIFTDIV